MKPLRLHIFGASGSGTTTLGRALAADLGLMHFDIDDFFWEMTDPPYTHRRPASERQKLLQQTLADSSGWLLSGWLGGWGDLLIPQFQAVIFLNVSTPQRLERLERREIGRFGVALNAGSSMEAAHRDFLAWAGSYESGESSRNRSQQETWLAALPCPVRITDNGGPFDETLQSVLAWLEQLV